VLCGCASTQTTAARLQLNDDRIRASEQPIPVARIGTSGTVTSAEVTVLSTGGRFTAVVALMNRGAATSDLPLIVGYRLKGRTVYLNAGAQSNYFDNHIPAIAGHGSLNWVDTGSAKLPEHAVFFAIVGAKPASPAGSGVTPPNVTAAPPPVLGVNVNNPSTALMIPVDVTNHSAIPQYQLPVYAVVTEKGRVVSASSATIAELNGGAHATVKLSVPGNLFTTSSDLRVEAPATIFK
jgi:hypothetical protein